MSHGLVTGPRAGGVRVWSVVLAAVMPILGDRASSAGFGWTHLAGDAAHTSRSADAPAGLDCLDWVHTPRQTPEGYEEFVGLAGLVAAEGRVFLTARWFEESPEGYYEHTANLVIACAADSGERLWSTPVSPDAESYDSRTTPALDVRHGTVLYASGREVYALDWESGAVVWQTTLPSDVVNAALTVSEGLTSAGVPANRVFITDYSGFGPEGRLYALNVDPYDAGANPYQPGELVWSQPLPGTNGNPVACADGSVYVASTSGQVFAFAALDGTPRWITDTGAGGLGPYAGFYGGVTVRDGYVYAAVYEYYGQGDSSRLYKLDAEDGAVIWEQPCERTAAIPIVADDGRIYLSAGIDGFGSAVKIQAFQDEGDHATALWDTFVDTDGSLVAGGFAHQPLLARGRLYAGRPDASAFFGPYAEAFVLDPVSGPGVPGFVLDQQPGCGGSPAAADGRLYTLGTQGLFAFCGAARGDLDCDGNVNAFDIDPFILALTDPTGYAEAYSGCDRLNADVNEDGHVDAFDIDAFVGLLTG